MLFLFVFTVLMAQGLLAMPKDTIQKDAVTLPLYNLYQLSRYITLANLGTDGNNQVYNKMVTLLRTPFRPVTIENTDIDNFMKQVTATKLSRIEAIVNLHAFSENNMGTLIPQANGAMKIVYENIVNLDKQINELGQRSAKIASDTAFLDALTKQIEQLTTLNINPSSSSCDELKQQIKSINDNINWAINSIKTLNDSLTAERSNLEKWDNNTVDSFLQTQDSASCAQQYLDIINNQLKKHSTLASIKALKLELRKDTTTATLKTVKVNREDELKKIGELIYEYEKSKISTLSSSGFIELLKKDQSVQQLIISGDVQSAEQNSSSPFRLPSETEIINAMAVFLATRAKQEAMVWFMDKLKSEVNNPLVFDAFPKTIELLRQPNAYSDISFGTVWRYALAEDLVKMPTHLVNSTWMEKNWYGENSNEIKDLITAGSEMLRLIQAQYSYRDIIRYFYLHKPVNAGTTSALSSHLSRTFTFLYILVNELYIIDHTGSQPHYRLLTLEEINAIDLAQWKILISLINIKYGQEMANMLLPSTFTKGITGTEAPLAAVKKLNREVSTILLSLAQFDKIEPSKSPSSVWENLREVLCKVDPKRWDAEQANATSLDKHLASFGTVLSIYEDIQNKNFIQAAQTFLNLSSTYLFPNGDRIIKITTEGSVELPLSSNSKQNISFTIPNLKLSTAYRIKYSTDNLYILDPTAAPTAIDLTKLKKELSFLNYVYNEKKISDIDQFTEIKKMMSAIKRELQHSNEKDNYRALLDISFLLDMLENPYAAAKNPMYSDYIKGNLGALQKYAEGEKLMKITSFFSDVLTSTDANSLAKVIDKHVLPPASYVIKRKMDWTITLNGYVGVYTGHQWHLDREPVDYEEGMVYGVTAPIGITVSNRWGGLFFQGLDLGNIVGHYLWDTGNAPREDLNFKMIISPGVNLLVNIPKSPFVAYAGVKYIPLERRSEENQPVYNRMGLDLVQVNLGIKVDIPIFSIAKWNRKNRLYSF